MIVAATGTGPPFDRLIRMLAAHRTAHPDERIWAQHGRAELPPSLEGAPFVPRDDLLDRMRRASAVVCHGGSGLVLEAIALGHVPVVVPRLAAYGEVVDDHQLDLLRLLGAKGLVVSVSQSERLAAALEAARRGKGPPRELGGRVRLAEAVSRDVAALQARGRSGPGRAVLAVLVSLGRSLGVRARLC